VTPSEEVAAVEEYDAMILRSAVYMGRERGVQGSLLGGTIGHHDRLQRQ
jgi:hypothetical protein